MSTQADELDDEAILRQLVRLVAAAALCLLAGGVAGVVIVRDRDDAAPTLSTGLPPVVSRGGTGPLEGTLVVDYLGRRGDELRTATGRRAAVVSFTTYRPVAEVPKALEVQGAGGKRLELKRLLLALPGGEPVLAPVDPRPVLASNAKRLTKEAEEMKVLGDTTQDPAFKADYANEARAKRAQAAAADDPQTGIVFAVVVVGDAEALRTLALTFGIRLVDVAASSSVPDAVRGLRPEEASTAGTPRTRPA